MFFAFSFFGALLVNNSWGGLQSRPVIPAEAGIQKFLCAWIPSAACPCEGGAGMTKKLLDRSNNSFLGLGTGRLIFHATK